MIAHLLALPAPVATASSWLSLVAVVFGLLGLGAGAVAYFRSQYVRAAVETLKESNAAYVARQTQLQDEVAQLRVESAHYKDTSAQREAENAVLREALSGRKDFSNLEALLMEHHSASLEHLGAVDRMVRIVLDHQDRTDAALAATATGVGSLGEALAAVGSSVQSVGASVQAIEERLPA